LYAGAQSREFFIRLIARVAARWQVEWPGFDWHCQALLRLVEFVVIGMHMMRSTGRGTRATIDVIAPIVGAALAISFVGFLAWKVGALPLQGIVAICVALMVYALFDDTRKRNKRNNNGI
jgi:hypothetical protein